MDEHLRKLLDNDASFREWHNSRPATIRSLIEQVPPVYLYRLNTGDLVTLISYSDNNTLMVAITRQFNRHTIMERKVFGIKPEELTKVCLLSESSQYEVKWTAEESLTALKLQEELLDKIEQWQKEIPDWVSPRKRGEMIMEKQRAYMEARMKSIRAGTRPAVE